MKTWVLILILLALGGCTYYWTEIRPDGTIITEGRGFWFVGKNTMEVSK